MTTKTENTTIDANLLQIRDNRYNPTLPSRHAKVIIAPAYAGWLEFQTKKPSVKRDWHQARRAAR